MTRFVGKKLANLAVEKNINVVPVYMNCRLENNNTEYRLISNLCSIFGVEVPESGLSVNRYDIYVLLYGEICEF